MSVSVYGPSAKRAERSASLGVDPQHRRAVIVLSDVHLAPTFDSDRLPFRSACFSPAAYLSQTIDRAVEHARKTGCGLEIVLAGDVFDFDVPQSAEEARTGLRLADTTTPEVAAYALHRMLYDHLPFTLALQRAAQAGGRVVVLPGNHDAQLGFVRVRKTLERVIGSNERPVYGRGAAASEALVFAPWYYAAADGAVHIEHGHLYDPLCTVARLCLESRGNTERTIGTVSSFYAPLLLPGVDPFVVDPFAERRSFRETTASLFAGFAGSAVHGTLVGPDTTSLLACMRELFAATSQSRCTSDEANVLAFELGIEPAEVDYLRGFFAAKATASEVLAICTGGVDYAGSVEERTRRAMTAATVLHGASVAVVGHTHRPGASLLPNGSTLLNSGAWTPRRTASEPVGSYAWITAHEGRIDEASVRHVYRNEHPVYGRGEAASEARVSSAGVPRVRR